VSEAAPIRVMVVDDHPMWREGVSRDLTEAGYDVVAATGEGVGVIHGLTAAGVEARVLVLSASGEHQDVLDAVKAGAAGYLVKSAGRGEFLDAVRRTAEGDAVFTPGLAGLVLGEYRRLATTPASDGDAPRLTERETEILRLVAKGLSYRQIAERLVVSHRTVQNHVQNTLNKLQLHNRVELVRYAIEQGLDGET
jgi:DNA-binding NarL/FixJ family response regulator